MSEYLVFEKKRMSLSPRLEKRLENIKNKTGESYEDIINRILDEHGEQEILESINYLDRYKKSKENGLKKQERENI